MEVNRFVGLEEHPPLIPPIKGGKYRKKTKENRGKGK